MTYDVAVVGAGIAGLTAGLILAKSGLSVVILESHTVAGGCAGYFSRGEFSFDVGATTFVSFQPTGIAGQLFSSLGVSDLPLKRIRQYRLCLPDRTVVIPDNWDEWVDSWSDSFPELGIKGKQFFRRLADRAQGCWRIADRFPSLPLSTINDLRWSLGALRPRELGLLPWLAMSFEQWLRSQRVTIPPVLRGAFNMLLQDTTQTDCCGAPAAWAFLGLTLMPYGLYSPVGGTRAFFSLLQPHFECMGGRLLTKHRAVRISRDLEEFRVECDRGRAATQCRAVVSAIPVWNTFEMAPELFNGRLDRYLSRRSKLDSAFALFLGCKDIFENSHSNHLQVLSSVDAPLGDGNNFLLSISPANDRGYAPVGFRSLTISTHTDPHRWAAMTVDDRAKHGSQIVEAFLRGSERYFPGIRDNIVPEKCFPATPLTYQRFTGRYLGMAGNQGLSLSNASLRSIPQSFGTPRFYQTGDTTFPGVGTVSCVLSAANVAKRVIIDLKNSRLTY